MENQEAYDRAKKRVEAKQGFYWHLVIYLAVIVLLAFINFSKSPDYLWFKWPLFGWGIAVFFHAMNVFVISGRTTITDKLIEKEMKKEALKKQ